ncbi:trigger factor [Candidatus Pelagibacter sp.]|jgi:trigger factor|uniref:trigger factor n=1 Tax=uncultured Candidatus Pelagibacter sp. TaxID=372654 RepID=UPI00233D0150|nr:trigger factor [uncultured Candidatus Pelagibacter sp.]MDB4811636.1 trigger factor [Candidatus Pelagibacter sp.]MDC1077727.1 trigger factor [Candidatus Pelagibacter sp.]
MKVTVENIKGLNKDLKVLIDKETMSSYMDEKYEEIKGTVNLKGFRPGKVPKEVLKRQFGKAIFGEVLDKVLKETSTKALEENKIKPAGQPKLDLKTYGEDKELEYVLSVTELPKVEVKSIESIKFDQYSVKIDNSETDKRIKEIAKNQPSFKEASAETKAKEGDLVILDYQATVDGKEFKGSEGKNTQLTLGKDLFLKGFDKQLIGVKKDDEKIVDAVLPENFPEKELVNKDAKFKCKILNVKNPEEVKIDDNFAKNLGAKDLNDLKILISKQINDEYKNSLDQLSKNQILKEIEKIKVDEIPENLISEEVKILSQGMDEEEAKKNKTKFTETAKTRIKTGLILNEFGEQNKIQVSEQEIQAEVQKQLRMMPGQEKMVMDFYQKNPSAVASLRGTVYEEKILNLIKEKAKPNKKEITKEEAEKILKEANKHDHEHDHGEEKKAKTKTTKEKKSPPKASKPKPTVKKVSKK